MEDKEIFLQRILRNTPIREGAMSYVTDSDIPDGGMSSIDVTPSALADADVLAHTDFPAVQEPNRIHTGRVAYKANEVPMTGTESTVKEFTPAEKMQLYTTGSVYAIKAGESLVNGFLANSSAKMKAKKYEFQAEQNLRSADLLLKNQREVSRAAQADAAVYKMQRAEVKAKQKTAMAATGFAVGKGVYKTTLDTTDARTNYNVSAIILKSELQNAELTRQAGLYRAQAEIERGNAKVAEIEGKAAMWKGITNAVAYAAVSGMNFYVGANGVKTGNTISKTTGPDGQKAWAVNGTPMYGRG